MHRNVAAFARWLLDRPVSDLRPPFAAATLYAGEGYQVCGTVLYRAGSFQAELFTVAGAAVIPEHAHPNVDSIEVMMAGAVDFTVGGRPAIPREHFAVVADDGALSIAGAKFRVRPGEMHGAVIGPEGGVFLSIQHWLHGIEPSSVGLDWDGPEHTRGPSA